MSQQGGDVVEPTMSFEEAYGRYTRQHSLMGTPITVTSAPIDGPRIDIEQNLRRPDDFHADYRVHDVVILGKAMVGLIGEFDDPRGFFADRDRLPEKGVMILSDHFSEAQELVVAIDGLARRVIENDKLYDDRGFCTAYRLLAAAGYDLLRRHMGEFSPEYADGIPVSLERAGLVATRLAHGLDQDAEMQDEVRVVTKRAHPKYGDEEDLMVTVQYRDFEETQGLHGQVVDQADFVNPASWASTAGLTFALLNRGIKPTAIVHRSIMATRPGIEFAHTALERQGIVPIFYSLGAGDNLDPNYYLYGPAVADAGHMLRHFLPNWHQH